MIAEMKLSQSLNSKCSADVGMGNHLEKEKKKKMCTFLRAKMHVMTVQSFAQRCWHFPLGAVLLFPTVFPLHSVFSPPHPSLPSYSSFHSNQVPPLCHTCSSHSYNHQTHSLVIRTNKLTTPQLFLVFLPSSSQILSSSKIGTFCLFAFSVRLQMIKQLFTQNKCSINSSLFKKMHLM